FHQDSFNFEPLQSRGGFDHPRRVCSPMRRIGTKRSLRVVAQVLTVGILAFGLACSSTGGSDVAKEGAETRPQTVVGGEGSPLQVHMAEAQAQLEAGNFAAALAAVDKAYELDKNNREVIQLRSRIKSAQQQ